VNPNVKPLRTALRPARNQGTYKEFDATELYCPRCRRAVPVRKRLLLVLPEGDKYEYLCAFCSSTVGTKTSRGETPIRLIV
jgi:DNA-directed RNA polymerase subunit RPC12/RpoP